LQRYLESYLKLVLQALVQKWYPLQIKGTPEAEQKYEHYIKALYSLLVFHKPLVAITEYLWKIEAQVLGPDSNFTHIILKSYLLWVLNMFTFF